MQMTFTTSSQSLYSFNKLRFSRLSLSLSLILFFNFFTLNGVRSLNLSSYSYSCGTISEQEMEKWIEAEAARQKRMNELDDRDPQVQKLFQIRENERIKAAEAAAGKLANLSSRRSQYLSINGIRSVLSRKNATTSTDDNINGSDARKTHTNSGSSSDSTWSGSNPRSRTPSISSVSSSRLGATNTNSFSSSSSNGSRSNSDAASESDSSDMLFDSEFKADAVVASSRNTHSNCIIKNNSSRPGTITKKTDSSDKSDHCFSGLLKSLLNPSTTSVIQDNQNPSPMEVITTRKHRALKLKEEEAARLEERVRVAKVQSSASVGRRVVDSGIEMITGMLGRMKLTELRSIISLSNSCNRRCRSIVNHDVAAHLAHSRSNESLLSFKSVQSHN